MTKSDEKKGYVYLLGDFEKEGAYKIGVTRGTIERRIKKLQTGNNELQLFSNLSQAQHTKLVQFSGFQRKVNNLFMIYSQKCVTICNILRLTSENLFISDGY